jgi:hypothetical protein
MISIRNAKFAKIGLIDLCEWIGDTSNMTMIEIGSFVGDSTEIFAQRFKNVISIDPYIQGYDKDDTSSQFDMEVVEAQFLELCKKYDNIVKIKLTSKEAVEHVQQKVDFIYIDGNHQYEIVKEDATLWLPYAKSFIGGHDYMNKHHPKVIDAVHETIGEPDKTFRDTSWIKRL